MKAHSILGGKVIHIDFTALKSKKPPTLPSAPRPKRDNGEKPFKVSTEVEAVFAQRQETIIPPPPSPLPPCKCWDCTTGPMEVTGPKYGTTATLLLVVVTAIIGWCSIVYVFAKLVL